MIQMVSKAARTGAAHLLLAVGLLASAQAAGATTVMIDTAAAKAMLVAIGDPHLTLDQARTVVEMKGNQGAIRKLREFKIPASTETFAKAVYDAAHGNAITDDVEKSYYLDMVKANEPAIAGVIHAIDSDPDHFQKAIEQRIAQFTPANADIHLTGYVIAGGDGGGYAFGGSDFYLNLGPVHDLLLARAVTNHEMYHAVQGSFAAARGVRPGDPDASFCSTSQRLFESLYEEGSAVLVEDQSLVDRSSDAVALRKKTDIDDGLKHIGLAAALLEMSVDALKSSPPVPFDDVYSVGFYGHGVLYSIGYEMARDIVAQDGPDGLIRLLNQPSYDFVLRYIRLARYGLDAGHPKLGEATIAAAEHLATGCR